MNVLPLNKSGAPYLLLAPMEGVGDSCFRRAIARIGGMDEVVRDFIRVPINANPKSLTENYDPTEISPLPLAAQIMGQDPELMGEVSFQLMLRGAPRIDLNCGCPSNVVTGKGAGSSLLKDPEHLHKVAKSMVQAVGGKIPVTAKLRSGFHDTSLFKENLLAAEASGIQYLTLHPRTKVDGYGPPAKWELIAAAKSILKIPVVGNGDILNLQDALKMLELTKCDALMIGRGAIINPFIFHQIKAHFSAELKIDSSWQQMFDYLNHYTSLMDPKMNETAKINKMKQMIGFLFKANSSLLQKRQEILRSSYPTLQQFLQNALLSFQESYGD